MLDHIKTLEDAFAELSVWLYTLPNSTTGGKWSLNKDKNSRVTSCTLIWDYDNRTMSIHRSNVSIINVIKECLEEYYTNFTKL